MKLVFRQHAVQRMFERGISTVDIRSALETGQVIKEYNDDTPYPSALLLGYIDQGPLHVVLCGQRDRRRAHHRDGLRARPQLMDQ
ncbi:DUF4258 domain-containing protein [Accumulibacter sp.]|uniref:DUF4258 domain-containing protein n=1 Tax=Accumulibacter sp. TaxID=2053492 RepID=UPI0028C3C7D2|nr:DUF4258 domain-containing protein [Accumulibacter sp.]